MARGKPDLKNPLGKVAFDRAELAAFQAKPLETKRDILRAQWVSLAHMLLAQAGSLAMCLPKKDFGRMVQLLTSSGIAYDKVFPKVETLSTGNLVLNLFNGLPKDNVVRVIGAVDPPIDITPTTSPVKDTT